MAFACLSGSAECRHSKGPEKKGRKELQPGDELDPNEIYFLSDGNDKLQKLVSTAANFTQDFCNVLF